MQFINVIVAETPGLRGLVRYFLDFLTFFFETLLIPGVDVSPGVKPGVIWFTSLSLFFSLAIF